MNKLSKELYCAILPIMFWPSTIFGMMVGIGIGSNHTPGTTKKPFDMFINAVGYTSIGMITGFTFPISMPLIGGYIVYRDFIRKEK